MIQGRVLTSFAALAVCAAFGAQAQTPRAGGTIRFTAPYGSSFSSLDIHTTVRSQDEIHGRALHRSLYAWDAFNNKPTLELATEVAVSGDGLVYTYKLRTDAFFHNGRRMTADDVVWSYKRVMDGAKPLPGSRYVRIIKGAAEFEKGQSPEISGLKKIDDSTIEITLNEKVEPGFSLKDVTTSIYPPEEASKEGFAQKPVGLGPYKFVEHVPGSRLVVEKWEKFYKPGRPYADRVVISIMPEAAARDVAFRNKEIDASVLGPAQYVAYKADPVLSKGLLEVAEVFTRYMGMNPAFKPFSDKRVRQAVNYAIDTDLIIKRLVKDKAYRATSWLPSASSAFDKDAKPYPFDPDRAKKLLVEAGYPDGFEFEWTASGNESWGSPIAEAVIPMLAKVGIRAKIKPVESSALVEIARKGDYQGIIYSQQTGPDPMVALKCFYSTTTPIACNYMAYKNPTFDALIDEAAATDDPAKRIAALKAANAVLYEDAPVWFFNYNKAVMAFQPWLKGLQPNATELAVQSFEDIWVDASSPAAK